MNPPAVLGIVAAIVLVAIAVGVFLSFRFPHWGMYHTTNRPAPGVTEARYLQTYENDDEQFITELLARIRSDREDR